MLPLPPEGLIAGPVRGPGRDLLGRRQRERRAQRHLPGQGDRARQRLAGRPEHADQPGRVQPLRRVVLAGQRDLHGQVIGNALRQPDQSARGGGQAPPDLGRAEPGRLAGHDQVTGQGQLEPAGQRVALDRRDQRLGRRPLDEAAEAGPSRRGHVAGRKPLRSMPAQNVPPAPVSTSTRTSPRRSIPRRRPRYRATGPLTAFRPAGG